MHLAAPLALEESGAQVSVLFDQPDGTNINAGCGSTHIGALQEVVAADGYDLGLAFDGDGDRVLAVDAAGDLVDGDFIIAILARHLKSQGKLRGDTVVTTVMTNLGFHQAMRREGIEVLVTPVGDRYVVAEMMKGDYLLGGEQSGHIINRDVSTTGDGLATSLLLLQALRQMDVPAGRGGHRHGAAAAEARQRARARPRRARRRGRGVGGGGAGDPPPGRHRPRARPPVRHRAARARDGRGADAGRGRRRLRPHRRGRSKSTSPEPPARPRRSPREGGRVTRKWTVIAAAVVAAVAVAGWLAGCGASQPDASVAKEQRLQAAEPQIRAAVTRFTELLDPVRPAKFYGKQLTPVRCVSFMKGRDAQLAQVAAGDAYAQERSGWSTLAGLIRQEQEFGRSYGDGVDPHRVPRRRRLLASALRRRRRVRRPRRRPRDPGLRALGCAARHKLTDAGSLSYDEAMAYDYTLRKVDGVWKVVAVHGTGLSFTRGGSSLHPDSA